MAIEVFNRYEKKYMLTKKSFRKLLTRIEDHMDMDKYNINGKPYTISNIYFDTDNDALIRASIEKPVYKEKLRMRAYGTPSLDDKVFIEIKKKYDGIVNKRRTSMTLKDAYNYILKDNPPTPASGKINTQVLHEIDYFKDFYKVKPKLYLSYDRYAYFEKNDGDFRVTFDTNIQTRRYDVSLEKGQYGSQLLEADQVLMEIKISGAVPMWFTKILSELEVYPVSFSKYGTEYKRYVLENTQREFIENKGEIICSNQFYPQLQAVASL